MSDLDYKIKYITSILDAEFHGTTESEKQDFVDKYWGETEKAIAQSLEDEYPVMLKELKEGVPNE